jgi:aldose 1-epimerase
VKEPYGRLADGTLVERCRLSAGGLQLAVLTWGAVIERLEVPDGAGGRVNVVLGLRSLADYVALSPSFGAAIGRYANRIAGARFVLDGVEHRLPANDGPHCLHGGPAGFGRRVWTVLAQDPARLLLGLASPAGEAGFPGRLAVRLTYTLEPDALRLDWTATTDAPTVLNLTSHSYFNLAGEASGSALGHELMIAASRHAPVDAALIPTGALAPVEGTRFDFRAPRQVAEHYDTNWALDRAAGAPPSLAAILRDPASRRVMELWTDQPGLQCYTGSGLHAGQVGPGGLPYAPGAGLALETQHFPDSPNRPDFPSTVLRPGEVFRSATIHRFK